MTPPTKPPSRRAVAERVYDALVFHMDVGTVRERHIWKFGGASKDDILAAIERAIGEAGCRVHNLPFTICDKCASYLLDEAHAEGAESAKRPARRGGRK